MMKRIVVVAIAFAPALASADPAVGLADDANWGARSRISFLLGLATPIGSLGFEYTQLVAPYLEVGAGMGVGFTGAQFSLTPRLRIGQEASTLTLGGASRAGRSATGQTLGSVSQRDPACAPILPCCGSTPRPACRQSHGGGMMGRLYGGIGKLVAHGSCTGYCGELDGTTLPYVGLAIGHTL